MSTAAATVGQPAPPRVSNRRTIWERLDDAVNPIVVKELRQAVSSNFVVAVLIIFLLLQLLCMGIYLSAASIGGRLDAVDFREGRDAFLWMQGILHGTCMLFIPLYTSIRLAAERNEANTDLLFITTIKPRSIIAGKMISAMVLAVLIFSSCVPFMALTFYLRGIDWITILFVLGLDFLVILAGVQLMVFIAVIPCHVVFKALLALMGLGILFLMFMGTMAAAVDFLMMGLFVSRTERAEFWAGTAAFTIAVLATCGQVFVWSVALLSPVSSNRALLVRTYLVGMWVTTLIAAVAVSHVMRLAGPLFVWVTTMYVAIGLNLFISINDRRGFSPRVARTIPRVRPFRVLAFFFYNGAAGGILFSLVLGAITYGVSWLGHLYLEDWISASYRFTDRDMNQINGITLLFVYAVAYALTAVFLQSLMRRSVPYSLTWVLMLILLAVGSLVPVLATILIFRNRFDFEDHYGYLLTCPFSAVYPFFNTYRDTPMQRLTFASFAGAWTLLACAVNVPWFMRQIRAFRRPDDVPTPAVVEAIPVPEPATPPPVANSQAITEGLPDARPEA